MKFFLIALALLFTPQLSAAQLQVPKGNPKTPVERYGKLRVQGNRIVGQDGKPVVLRGMSLFWSQWMGEFYNAEAIEWLRNDWGCDVVRVAMGVEQGGYLENPQQEVDKVKTVVDAAIALGMYVIIDWHDHNAHRHQDAAKTFFAAAAQHYGTHPNVIYEIYNEPLKEYLWAENIKPYHTAIIQTIRQHDPNNLIVCGTPFWCQKPDEAARDPLPFTNIAYSLHFYAGTHKQAQRDAAAAALKSGVALFATEFGASQADGNGKIDVEETKKWWQFLEENQISWCNWSLADKVESSAALREGTDYYGDWSERDLTESGILVRSELRRHAQQAMAPQAGSTPKAE